MVKVIDKIDLNVMGSALSFSGYETENARLKRCSLACSIREGENSDNEN